MPYTSVAAVEAGVSAGKLMLQDPSIELLAPVVEGS
jgi:hypothetical protein